MESIIQLQHTIKLSQVKIKLHQIKSESGLNDDDFEDLIMDFMNWSMKDGEEEIEIENPVVEDMTIKSFFSGEPKKPAPMDVLFINIHKPNPNRIYKYGTKGVSPAGWGEGIWIFRGFSYLNKKPVNKTFKGVDAKKDATNYARGVWNKYPDFQ